MESYALLLCFDVFYVACLAFCFQHCGWYTFVVFLLNSRSLKSLFSSSSAYLPFPSVSAQLFYPGVFSLPHHSAPHIPSIILPSTWCSFHHLHLLFFLLFCMCTLFNHPSLTIRHSLSSLFCSCFNSRSPSLYIKLCPSSYGGPLRASFLMNVSATWIFHAPCSCLLNDSANSKAYRLKFHLFC